jgi:hypothetical protein
MDSMAVPWDGRPMGPGPIALIARETSPGTGQTLCAASSGCGRTLCVRPEQVGAFLAQHASELLVSIDVAPVQLLLCAVLGGRPGEKSGLDALWALTRDGQWVDLRLLDRQVRCAAGDNNHRLRSWQEITDHWLATPADNAEVDRNQASGDRLPVERDGLSQVLAVFDRLGSEAKRLEAEAAPLPPPPLELRPLPPEKEEAMRAQTAAILEDILAHDKRVGRDRPAAMADDPGPEARSPEPIVMPAPGPAPLGHGVEVWAVVALNGGRAPGLTVDPRRVPELLARALEEYRRASEVLARKREVRNCFDWEGNQVARNNKGFPVTRQGPLIKWLRQAYKGLGDIQNEAADVPRDAEGCPPVNPERWGFWAACDDALWAWRQVFRMAEVVRIASSGGVACPRYETVPLLRSLEPNLAVYRSLGVPAFRPRDGHVFIAGRLRDLTARCLSAVCLSRGYVTPTRCKLDRYVLREPEPLQCAAAQLRAHYAERVGATDDVCAMRASFPELREADPGTYDGWLRLTNALLETAPLGLPVEFRLRLLRNDHDLNRLDRNSLERLHGLLVKKVAWELEGFLEDATFDVVATQLGLNANEGLRRLVNADHPGVTGQTLRNDLRRRRHRKPVLSSLRSLAPEQPAAGSGPASRRSRAQLYRYRAATLGGRVTHRGASAAVRRREVLLGADEVMLAVAHDLTAAGHRLLGLAGSEFLLEVPSGRVDRQHVEEACEVAHKASGRILGDLAAQVAWNVLEEW